MRSSDTVPDGHVVFWKQRDIQDFGGAHHLLLADGGNVLPCHSVDLVEGMRTNGSVVCCADEQQQTERLLAVPVQLQTKI